MRYWFDTEFIEDGFTIDLISIGIVCEDGREFYAINEDCDFSKASEWVQENVIKQLPPKPQQMGMVHDWWKKETIKNQVALFLGCEGLTNFRIPDGTEKPEIWAYYADYDWVAFCQLFGTMMDLPEGFPYYCRDIKQWCDRLGNPELPKQEGGHHNALEDARWNKKAWEFLNHYSLVHG